MGALSATPKLCSSLTAVLVLAYLPCLAGCGTSGKVTGKVTYLGKPVRGGKVSFYGANNWAGTSSLEEDGSYTISDVPRGTVKITVDTSTFRPNKLPGLPDISKRPIPPNMPEQAKNNPMYNPRLSIDRAKRYMKIPKKYADPEKTDLAYEVKPGVQTHDIDLE